MRGDLPGRSHPHRGDLPPIGPHPGEASAAARFDTQIAEGGDDHPLDAAHVFGHPGPGPEVPDRVSDELPRAVKSDVTSPVHPPELGADNRQRLLGHEQVGGVPEPSHGVHRGVLE